MEEIEKIVDTEKSVRKIEETLEVEKHVEEAAD